MLLTTTVKTKLLSQSSDFFSYTCKIISPINHFELCSQRTETFDLLKRSQKKKLP